jgi:hypothetical protein
MRDKIYACVDLSKCTHIDFETEKDSVWSVSKEELFEMREKARKWDECGNDEGLTCPYKQQRLREKVDKIRGKYKGCFAGKEDGDDNK